MSTIQSQKVLVPRSDQEVFDFLVDFNNFEKLMPEGKISGWKSDTESCSFQINGLAKIGMRITNKTPHSEVNIVSDGKNPFEFTLNIYMTAVDASSCEAYLVFDGKMNPFLSTMVTKPLTNFFNMLATNLKELPA